MAGIQETVDVIEAVGVLKQVIIKHVKDGFQVTDLVKIVEDLLSDAEAKEEIGQAIDGIEKVLEELKDLSWSEKLALIQKIMSAIL